jgi:hypothetical protein
LVLSETNDAILNFIHDTVKLHLERIKENFPTMEIAKDLRAVIATAEKLKYDLINSSEAVRVETNDTARSLNNTLLNIRNEIETLNAEYKKSVMVKAIDVLKVENLYENEAKEQERVKYIEIFLRTQSTKLNQRYKANQCYVGDDILFCESVTNYFCELVHDTMAHIYDEQNENRDYEVAAFQNWLEEKEIANFIQFILDDFLCQNEIYRNNMKNINTKWSLNMLLACDNKHNDATTDMAYKEYMQTGLNNRRKLFTYVFGVKYILRGCNIVEVVIEKINQFIETVLVVETGHSNINMINKVKQVLWNHIIEVYYKFISDFKDLFWESIIHNETFDAMNNVPFESFQFPNTESGRSNNNDAIVSGNVMEGGGGIKNSMQTNLEYINKQHQRLKQIHTSYTNVSNDIYGDKNTKNNNSSDFSGTNEFELIETLRALKRIEMEKNVLLKNAAATSNSRNTIDNNNRNSKRMGGEGYEVISYIPSCIILVESAKEILSLFYVFENNNLDSTMLQKATNNETNASDAINKRPINSRVPSPSLLSSTSPTVSVPIEDDVGTVESLLTSWFQTVSYCLDSLCTCLTGVDHHNMIKHDSNSMNNKKKTPDDSFKPVKYIEVSKRLEVIFSVKWVIERMVEMEQHINDYKAFVHQNRNNSINISNILKECENRFFHNTVNSLTVEIVRELCEYHLVLDVFTNSTMPNAEFHAVNNGVNKDGNIKIDNVEFKKKIIDEGKYDQAIPSGLMIASLEWLQYVKKIILKVFPKDNNNTGKNILQNVLIQTFELMLQHPSWEHFNVSAIGSESELNAIQERLLLDGHILLHTVLHDDVTNGDLANDNAAVIAANKFFSKCRNLNPHQKYFWEANNPLWFKKLPNYYEAVDCDEL